MSKESEITMSGIWRKIVIAQLPYFELGIGFNAVVITTIWAMLAVLKIAGVLMTIQNTPFNIGVFYVVFTLLAAALGLLARKVYKRLVITNAQRWTAMGCIYVYVLLAIFGMYLTIK